MAILQQMKEAVGLAEKPRTIEDEVCPQLTYRQRITGYITCFILSFIMSIGSFTRLVLLVRGNPRPFVFFYSLSNVLAIVGSLFLSGPRRQCKMMWDPTRRFATLFYLLSIFFTVFCAFYEGIPDDGRIGIIILCVFVQWIAMLWYTISFIPFARDYVCLVCCQAPRDACNKIRG